MYSMSSGEAHQPISLVIVRDARWMIPLAQSLITDELAPYFEVARSRSQSRFRKRTCSKSRRPIN